MNFFNETGAYRDEEDGVLLRNTFIFLRGGEMGLTAHLYGNTSVGTPQVCSPLRSYENLEDKFVFTTRSYNKYVVYKDQIRPANEDSINFLKIFLTDWLGVDKVIKVLDDSEVPEIPFWDKAPHPSEVQIYGIKQYNFEDKFKGSKNPKGDKS